MGADDGAGVDDRLRVGGVELEGRIALPPMETKRRPRGLTGEALVEHYRAIAANPHVALVIVEHAYVHESGKASPGQLSIARVEDIPGLARLAEAVHGADPQAKAFVQISHAGLHTSPAVTGSALLAPTGDGLESQTLSVADIAQVVAWFADAAGRAQEAGFDGVEVHSAHGYLLNEFYSPLANRRDDAYGAQSVASRVRIHVEMLAAIREVVGDGYPVAVRLGASDYVDGGSTIADGIEAAALLGQAGADLIDVSGGMRGFMWGMRHEPGWFADASAPIRERVSVPVMVTGGVHRLKQAQALLDEGAADIIGIGRALYNNPRWEMR